MNDLELPRESDGALWDAMAGHHLAARHFTRLLDHEAALLLGQGLRPYSRELFEDRIDEAVRRGFIPPGTGDELKASTIPAGEQPGRGRWKAVYLSVGRTLEERPGGAAPLLGTWGGEGIYASPGNTRFRPALSLLGRPAVVHVLLPTEIAREATFFPPIGHLLVGARRKLRGVIADVAVRRPVPVEAIDRVEFLD